MDRTDTTYQDRRGFLTRAAAGAVVAAMSTLPAWVEGQQPRPADPEVDSRAAWLRGVDSKYRQFFETGAMNNFIPLLHVANYYGAWRATAGVRHDDVKAVVGIFGMAIPVVFGDRMWEKYQLGRALNLTDAATGQPYVRNPYLAPRDGELFGAPELTIASLQGIGARFILCNNALNLWVGLIAKASGQGVESVRAELLGQMSPGITIVPAMVQATEQAQRAGLTYMKNS